MNNFTRILSEGDLRSDGFANEVARIVSEQPSFLPDLMEALVSSNPSVRGHAADSLEKVARDCPNEVAVFLPSILRSARKDTVAMVRWHLAMVLGHVSMVVPELSKVKHMLLLLLKDESSFVRSWAITSLCIIAKNSPGHAVAISNSVARLLADPSTAVAKRARTALQILRNPAAPLPKTWVKSAHLRHLCNPET
jgi:HEAT repeat protein